MLEDINDLGGKTPPEAYRFVLNDPTQKLVEAERNISFIREHLSLYDFFLMMKKIQHLKVNTEIVKEVWKILCGSHVFLSRRTGAQTKRFM